MNNSYTAIAKLFHWGMALLFVGLITLGFVMTDMSLSPEKLQYYAWHKWAGVTVFMLVWLRLGWRVLNPPPAYPVTMSPMLQRFAHLGHAALYGLMVVIPLSGWLMSSAKGVQTVWFGVLPLPDLLEKDKEMGHLLHEVHEALNFVLLFLLAGHVAAALKHHWIDKDDILKRMLPTCSTPKDNA
ncbi:MAG: cytochrome b [Pseudomonadota bacterium]|nr:cytochrome b [Pseudomonadota bacterium]